MGGRIEADQGAEYRASCDVSGTCWLGLVAWGSR
jgi:hypothetical protein